MSGCNEENVKVSNLTNAQENLTIKQEEAAPDYQNVFIYEVRETSVLITPPATDPEASYPVYEIFINEETKIEGIKGHFDELTKDDHVKVWVGRKRDEDKEIARRIVVIK